MVHKCRPHSSSNYSLTIQRLGTVLGTVLSVARDLPALYARVKLCLRVSIDRGTFNPLAMVWAFSPDFAFLQIGILFAFTTLQVAFIHIKPYRRRNAKTSRIRKMADAKFETFRGGLLWIWFSWLIAYVWLAICWNLKRWYEIPDLLVWGFADLAALCSGCACYYCFLVLDHARRYPKTRPKPAKLFRRCKYAVSWGAIIAIISVAGRAISISVLRDAGVPLIAAYNAFTMIRLFSRFETPKMKIPSFFAALIFLYAFVRQVNMNFVGNAMNTFPHTILLVTELILEVPLFIVLTYQMAGGRAPRALKPVGSRASQ